jgi:hypothetical protein
VLSLPGKYQRIETFIVLIAGSDLREIVSYSAQDAFAFEDFASEKELLELETRSSQISP